MSAEPKVLEKPRPTTVTPLPARGARSVLPEKRVVRRRTGRTLLIVGAILLAFFFYAFVVTGLEESRSQRALLPVFAAGVQAQSIDSISKVPVPGSPVALMEIPRIGLRRVVVEGSSPELLKLGPGHLPNTSLPGEFGNSVVLGRRLTYGAPFARLDEMQTGDSVTMITGQGSFTYVVNRVAYVLPGQPDVTGPTLDSRLTLVTSGPSLSPTTRLVIVAALQGNPVGVTTRPSVAVAPDEFGESGNVTGLLLAILWGVALVALIFLTRRIYKVWPVRAAYVVTTPAVIFLLWLVFENLDRLLPGTL